MDGCFAYSNGGCIALKERKCKGCRFYKPIAFYKKELIKSKARATEKGYYITSKDYEPLN